MLAVHADTWHLRIGNANFAKVIVSMNKNLIPGPRIRGTKI